MVSKLGIFYLSILALSIIIFRGMCFALGDFHSDNDLVTLGFYGTTILTGIGFVGLLYILAGGGHKNDK